MDAREYRRLALKYHPNRPGGSTEAFLKLRAQYEQKKNKKTVGDAERTVGNAEKIVGSSPRLAIQNPPPPMRSAAFQMWMRDQFSQRPSAVGMRVRGWRSPMHMLEAARRVPPGFDGCAPTENSIAVNQAVVYLAARVRAAQKVGETGGLLALHSTGSGKTLIGLAVLLAFWDSPVGVLFVSTPTNQRDNSAEVLGLLAVRFFPDFVSRTSSPARPFAPGTSAMVAAKRIEARLRRGMRERLIDPAHARVFAARSRPGLYTFQKLANDIGIFRRQRDGLLKDAVFVIDEAHYLNDPKMPGAAAVRRLLTTGRDPAATWCVAMTATPGETRADVATLLNAVAGLPSAFSPDRPFFPAARGMVSVARLETDGSRFARVRTTFASLPPPSPAFTAAVAKKKKKTGEGYSKAARDADHFAVVQGGTVGGVQVVQKRTQTVRTWIPGPKIEALLAYIADPRHDGLHYVYSGSVKTAQLVATLLKTRLGMTHYRPRRCRVRGRCEDPFPDKGAKNAFVTLDDLGSAAFSPFDALAPLTPQVVAARRHVVRAASEGTVKVVLATRESFKGVDIRGVRHVHALDPFENYKDYLQLVGRGPRLCAHADIPDMSKRVVDVVVYLLTTNGANTRVFRGAETRYRAAWGAIDDELGRAAVDREIFYTDST